MKLLTPEEIKDHRKYTLQGGLLGCAAGLAISLAGRRYIPRRFPHIKLASLPWSIKTAMFITPPTLLIAICAEEASNRFDSLRYSGQYRDSQTKEDELEWSQLSTWQKCISSLSTHKFKIITASWAGSLWASWHIINRDPIMTKAQKIVQARMYAQFITVLLLLGTIGLTTYESSLIGTTVDGKEGLTKKQQMEKRRWEHALEVAEREENRLKAGEKNKTGFQSNEDRIGAKIFK